METQRVLEEIQRQMGALSGETQWTAGAFCWRPRRLHHRVEIKSMGHPGRLQLASTIDVVERVRATPERVRLVLESLQDGAGVLVLDAVARTICSRAEFDVGRDSASLGYVVRGLLQHIEDAERAAPRLARVLAGRIPIIRPTKARARRTHLPTCSSGCDAVER